jgi:ribulose-phosphate 3-epimerase
MSEIVPTVTAVTPNAYAAALKKLAFAPRLHIDIADGEFAPSRTVSLNQIYWDRNDTLRTVDLHLMIKRPAEWLHQIVALAPDLVILHAEIDDADVNLPKIFEHLHRFNIKCGVAILPETTVEAAANFIKLADHVLVFGGHLGYQGGAADLSQLDKVSEIKRLNPDVEIAWDGGANLDNIVEIEAAGVDVINVGAAVARADDPRAAYEKLVKVLGNEI